MPEEIKIRGYKEGDEEAIVELLVDIFTEWRDRGSRALDFWKWMYLDNPLGDHLISVATSGNKIISIKHDLLLNIKYGKRKIVGCLGTDSLTHQDYRRRGIYFKLRERKYGLLDKHSAEMTYGITTNPILIVKEAEKDPRFPTNYFFPNRIIKMIWIKDIELHIQNKPTEKSWLKIFGFRTLRFANKIRYLTSKKRHDPKLEIVNTKAFGANMDQFWEKLAPHYNFIVIRDREYLNWRYCDLRAGEYHIKLAMEAGEVVGFIVYQVFNYENRYLTGRIIDLLTLPGYEGADDALVRTVMEYFEENDVNYVDSLIFRGHPYQETLARHGFIDRRETLYIRYNLYGKRETSAILEKSKPEELHFCHGDLFLA